MSSNSVWSYCVLHTEHRQKKRRVASGDKEENIKVKAISYFPCLPVCYGNRDVNFTPVHYGWTNSLQI